MKKSEIRKKIWLNDGWLFTETFDEKILEKECTCPLEEVRIPHTVKETPYHYFDAKVYQMVSGYRKVLHAPKEWEGKRVFLNFDSVGHGAWVYLNGEQIGEHHCGYTAFSMELTGKLRLGEDNILAVKVDSRESQNIPPYGYVIDYMTYGGIYREVSLEICGEDHIRDIFVKPQIPDEIKLPKVSEFCSFVFDGTVHFSVETDEKTDSSDKKISVRIREKKSREKIYENSFEVSSLTCKSEGGRIVYEISIPLSKVHLWDSTSPVLYETKVAFISGAETSDEVTVTFAFRRSEFKKNGYYLNGRRFKLRGLNRHQSYPYVGYAMPASMQKNDADILRFELGCNAARTSHYPQSHHFLDRCDEIGLLVFTEMPGWQHIGDSQWKDQAVKNCEEMVIQYRNHPSIILWGVRINESVDDDEFYTRTNEVAHRLDDTRPTGGVRFIKKSHLLEDVYTYNDFLHDGKHPGCDKKQTVTPDMSKPYLISEYNGHMYPTKAFDDEAHRLEHALRHTNVIDAVNEQTDIAGAFGWCMFDYNTHKDFGSGDRICYHGVMDMFRNPKLAAAVYASQQNRIPVLEVSSSMDIGEHAAGNRGKVFIFTNADSVRMYRGDRLLKEYTQKDSPYKNMRHAPILIDDYVGNEMKEEEGFSEHQNKVVKEALNYVAQYGMNDMPIAIKAKLAEAMGVYHMSFDQAYALYQKYVGNWGGEAAVFRFEAIKDGRVVKTVTKTTTSALMIRVTADHVKMREGATYDVAAVRIQVTDEYGNVAPFFSHPLPVSVEGPLEIIGPKEAWVSGGMGGTYLRTTGKSGEAVLTVGFPEEWKELGMEDVSVRFSVEA